MAENPLLPDAELRAMLKLLRRAVDPRLLADPAPRSRKQGVQPLRPQDRAAFLAGTLLQLRLGDIAVSTPGDGAASTLLTAEENRGVASLAFPPGTNRLHLAAGLASGLRRAGGKAAVLAFAQTGTPEPGWEDALAFAQNDRLPLILAIADPSGTELFREGPAVDAEILAWKSLQKTTSRLQLPVLSVDGEDAVATYRVMQESLLRARSGGGPAILWGALPAMTNRRGRSRAQPPSLQRLEEYMSTRRIRFS